MAKSNTIIEFGDFQTPLELACDVVSCITHLFPDYKTVIEPTCGYGTFLKAFVETGCLSAEKLFGWEINPDYVQTAQKQFTGNDSKKFDIQEQDFFQVDWGQLKPSLTFPVLFVGNPPWVTNSELGKLFGQNLPEKMNFKQHSGMDALTGKSNFDISEWMMIRIAHYISGTESAMAFLLKSSVARKIFSYIRSKQLLIGSICIKNIDAKKYFNVNVDACLFFAKGCHSSSEKNDECPVYPSIQASIPSKTMGLVQKQLVSNVTTYQKWKEVDSKSPFQWRSGIKHDCAKVMELTQISEGYINGFDEIVHIPDTFLYPMLKSSDVANKKNVKTKFMLVTQKNIGASTDFIEQESPETWSYLQKNAKLLNHRKSSIYKNAPPFAIFGVGDYIFMPWKVAISGLYKNLSFAFIPPRDKKPVVLDDTCYFLGFEAKETAEFVYKLLFSEPAQEFIDSLVFKDDKRPMTANLLNRINLKVLARILGVKQQYDDFFLDTGNRQQLMFAK